MSDIPKQLHALASKQETTGSSNEDILRCAAASLADGAQAYPLGFALRLMAEGEGTFSESDKELLKSAANELQNIQRS